MNQQELEQKIREANIAYSSGIPFMTDGEYDLLWQQLFALDSDNILLYHTAQDRTALTGLTWHKQQIFGTNKAFNMPDLAPFLMRFGNHELVIEPKYDGCAAVITHTKKGIAITLEGDGKCGKDVTHMMPFIKMPFMIRNFQAVEIILPVAEWNPEFGKNPRNVVAGWLSRKYDSPAAMMTAVPHGFGELRESYHYSGDVAQMSEILLKLYAEWSKVYPIDGLMIKVADEKLRLVAGNNGTTSAWSIAWKPPIQIKDTVVVEREWNVSRLGRVIPTIIYEPIDLCGTINSRVTANNAKWLEERGIRVGSVITVGKAGEIIPKILSVKVAGNHGENTQKTDHGGLLPDVATLPGATIHKDNKTAENANSPLLISECPTCQEPLSWEGVHLVCNGENCIAKKIVSIAYFYSAKGIKIDGIGEKTIEKLLVNRKCYEILSVKPWALLDCLAYEILPEVIDVLGPVIVTNLLTQIKQVNKTKHMAHFISGLGLPAVAYKTALRLCQYISTGVLSIHVHQKAKISFSEGALMFSDAQKEMTNFGFTKLPSPAKAIYCITGALSQSRDEMIEWLALQGYEFSAGVTRETNYLLVGDSPGKTKIVKAIKYDVPQITEAQLIKLLKN
jgi:NAD-dependent DNA ligase